MRTKQPTTKPRTEPKTAAPVSRGIRLAFEWFLGLPVQVVFLVLWVAGIVFFGACALLAYMGISALVELVVGAF
jgi:membrane protein YdbS with pleckstrin-like domain